MSAKTSAITQALYDRMHLEAGVWHTDGFGGCEVCDQIQRLVHMERQHAEEQARMRELDLLREVAAAARRLCDMGDYPALHATLKAWETR